MSWAQTSSPSLMQLDERSGRELLARCFALDNLGWQITTDWNAPLELLKAQARWAFAG